MGCVYKATNSITGMVYIGKTMGSMIARRYDHEKRSKHQSARLFFHKAIKKYCPAAFVWEVMFYSDNEAVLTETERRQIKEIKTKAPSGYNLTDGGDGISGFCVSLETRAKLRKASLGKKASPEARARMSAASKGVPKSASHLAAMRSESCKSKLRTKAIGRRHSQATRAKLSLIWKGRKHSIATKTKIGLAN